MTTAPLSSRRFACDRCRGQKLRYLREQADQERCDRCLKADAECLTTPTFITRNCSGDDLGSVTRKRQRRHNFPVKQRTPSGAYTIEIGNDISPLGGGVSAGPALPSSSIPVIAELSHAWDPAACNSELIDDFDGILSSIDYVSIADTNAQKRPSFEPVEVAHSDDFSLMQHFDIPSTSLGLRGTPSQHGTDRAYREAIGIALGDSIRTQNQDPRPSDETFAESWAHRLSNINIKSLSQMGRIDQGSPTVNLDMLITRSDELDPSTSTPIDDVLTSTREFLDALELLSQSSRPSATQSSKGDTLYGSEATTENPERQISKSPNQEVGSISAPGSLSSSGSSPGRKTCSGHSSALDVATQLLILSCYVHALRLYVVLFTHIHKFLQEIADSDEPTLYVILDLGFGNFPLQSGNLQATTFIQIATSLFEKIEGLLGLPQELRVTVRGGKPEGLLSEEEFTEAVKIILAKDEPGNPEQGKGGVKSLRRNMKRATQLLRESIAP
ncbi:hypothetical protein F5X99DRAFT_89699 [Biscogniauxia marginata]|nr:hypothetical protein F5X99DRAFT_89699 [Biscogniauxia marginata]